MPGKIPKKNIPKIIPKVKELKSKKIKVIKKIEPFRKLKAHRLLKMMKHYGMEGQSALQFYENVKRRYPDEVVPVIINKSKTINNLKVNEFSFQFAFKYSPQENKVHMFELHNNVGIDSKHQIYQLTKERAIEKIKWLLSQERVQNSLIKAGRPLENPKRIYDIKFVVDSEMIDKLDKLK